MEKVSVATRCPFMSTANEPESTIGRETGFLSEAGAAIATNARQPTAARPTSRVESTPIASLQSETACHLRSDPFHFLIVGFNPTRGSHVGRPPCLIQLAKL